MPLGKYQSENGGGENTSHTSIALCEWGCRPGRGWYAERAGPPPSFGSQLDYTQRCHITETDTNNVSTTSSPLLYACKLPIYFLVVSPLLPLSWIQIVSLTDLIYSFLRVSLLNFNKEIQKRLSNNSKRKNTQLFYPNTGFKRKLEWLALNLLLSLLVFSFSFYNMRF